MILIQLNLLLIEKYSLQCYSMIVAFDYARIFQMSLMVENLVQPMTQMWFTAYLE